MQEDKGSANTEVVTAVPVTTIQDQSYQRVVVTEIERDAGIGSITSLANNRETVENNPAEIYKENSDAIITNQEQTYRNTEGKDHQETEDSLVVIAPNEAFKAARSLNATMETYSEIQGPSMITDVNQENVAETKNSTTNAQEEKQQPLLNDQESHDMHETTKQVYETIVTLAASSEAASTSQATYLNAQSLNQLQNIPGHTLVNASELQSGLLDSLSQGTHYIINTPQLPNVNALQNLNQQNAAQVVLLQVPTSQSGNQVYVTNGNIQPAIANSSTSPNQQQDSAPVATQRPGQEPKKGRGRGRGKGKKKSPKQENPSASPPLRPLAPRMVAVPISSPLVIAGNSQVFTSVTPVDHLQQLTSIPSSQMTRTAGQHFEVLGRCVVCFRFCRTTTYCRAEKNHLDVRAAACAECESKGVSTVVCRRKRLHKGPNAYPPNIVINTVIQRAVDLKEMCIKNYLPSCFGELQSLTVHHADCVFSQPRSRNDANEQVLGDEGTSAENQTQYRKPTDYARGYLFPYSKEAWEQWLLKFCLQTGTSYKIRTGKRVNKKTDHGLANHNGKIVVYRALESQLHNCALGGKPRKKALREGTKRRKCRGSKLIGCPAVIHTRLVVTEEDWKALEITVPKLSAHLPIHDPRISATEMATDVNGMILSNSLYEANQEVANETQEEFAILEDVRFHHETESELTSEQMQLLSSLQIENLKKQTKTLMSTCGELVDDVSSLEILKSVHLHVQSLFNQLSKPVANQCNKRGRKRNAVEADLVDEEEVLEEGESRTDSVGQVVLLQTEGV